MGYTPNGETTFASLVRYEGNIPVFTNMNDPSCANTEEVIEDIYSLLGDIREDLPEGLREIVDRLTERVGELETAVGNLEGRTSCDILLGDCVDTRDLIDPCGQPITTVGQLFNYLIQNR